MSIVTIAHYSDTHGDIPERAPKEADIIVHSGDLLPNWSRGFRPLEESRQIYWLKEHREKFITWLNGKPCLMVMGNHDFVNAAECLRMENVSMLGSTIRNVQGVRFIGFPWVPYFTGEWNLECNEWEIAERFEEVADAIDVGNVDVLVTHAPMRGFLDRNQDGVKCGSQSILEGMMRIQVHPKAFLHGHIHESKGVLWREDCWSGMQISNAATGMNLIQLEIP